MATGARVIPILMELTRSIPIVTPSGADPVGYGYAESLAHPGRNVTGFSPLELSVVGKMLQTLKEIALLLAQHFRVKICFALQQHLRILKFAPVRSKRL